MATFNDNSSSSSLGESTISRRAAWSPSMTLLMPITPNSPSPPSAISLLSASPHQVLLFNPELDVSFEIDSVVQILIESPIRDSRAPAFSEMRVKIADEDRETYIRAAEMTGEMQATLKKLSSEELRAKYRVTRSDETGSRGLYTLVKAASSRGRPTSLQIPVGAPSPFAGLKTPKTAAAPKTFLGLLAPTSAIWSSGNSKPFSPVSPTFKTHAGMYA